MIGRRLTALLIPWVVVAGACSDRADAPSPASPITPDGSTRSADPSPALGLEVIYLNRQTVIAREVDGGSERTLAQLSSPDAVASPDGALVAYVTTSDPAAEEDFVAAPELRVLDVDSGSEHSIGPGFAPVFSPDGNRIAFLVPEQMRICEGEACASRSVVAVAASSGDEPIERLTEPGMFALLGWLDESVVVFDQSSPPRALIAHESGAASTIPYPPHEIWGPSPDGRWLLAIRGGDAVFESVEGRERTHVPLGRAALGEGAWAPDSSGVAAVAIGRGGPAASELVLVRPATRSITSVTGSRGAAGQVHWAPDARSLVYARSTGSRGRRLEAVFCPDVTGASACRPLFSWGRGVTLLALVNRS